MAAKSNLSVTLEGKGPVTLRPADHIATGGEGSIYKVAGMAVKMYLKPDEQRAAGLPDKIRLLAKLQHPFVGAPKGLVLDSKNDPVGHYLPFVDGHALSLVFTKDFWIKENFDVAQATTLCAKIRETVEFAHDHKAVMVDANELNWFAVLNGKSPEPRVIDVDSWAIDRWKASVIMPSIRDWNSKTFDERSDWFAWGIVTFQIFTGTHPYKGTLDGFARADLVGRMKANASVFSPGIKLNAAVRDFATIPGPLRDWYEATFQKGARTKPPSPLDKAVTTAPAARKLRTVVLGAAGSLTYEKLFAKPGDPTVRAFFCGVVQTASGELHDLATRRMIGKAEKNCEVVQVEDGWLIGDKAGFRHVSTNLVETRLTLQLQSRGLLSFENRMFAITEQGLSEVVVQIFGRPVASVANTWGVMVNSTKWFDGIGVLDAMGAMFLVVPFGADKLTTIRIKELDGLKPLAGKAGNRFASIVAADRKGDYHKFEFTFDRDYNPPKVWQSPADDASLNLSILPKGVCATIVRDGELSIFVPTNGTVRPVSDSQIATDMELANWRDVVVFVQNGDVWSLRLK